MGKTNYAGIDYGMGRSNIDTDTGIRYGIVSQNSLSCESLDDVFTAGDDLGYDEFILEFKSSLQRAIMDVVEEAGGSIDDDEDAYVDAVMDCVNFDNYESNGPRRYEDGDLTVQTTGDNDLFVFKSEYYTFAQFCSPCVPGAGNLDTPCDSGPKTYCLGIDWFDSDRPCPYPVYRIDTDECIYTPADDNSDE
jgi:hypothetical protein